MSAMAKGDKPVAVLRNPTRERRERPWLVCCGLCKPGLFGGDFIQPSTMQAVAWSADWQIAQNWAQEHAHRHEERRCATCGHLPTGEPTAAEVTP